MVQRRWVALLAGTFVLAAAHSAPASDTIRLGGSVGGNTLILDRGDDADADLELARYRGGWGGGYRGGYGYGGYRGGYAYRGGYGGFYGARYSVGYGYGGYRGGYYRPAYGYYRPYSYGYAQPYYYGGYTSYYSYPSYYYPSYSYYYPCSDSVPTMPYATVLQGSVSTYAPQVVTTPAPVAPPAGDGTFRYDGGPGVVPAPTPGETPAAPTVTPRPTLPLEGRLVSLPTAPTVTVSYPAYGEAPATVRPATSDTRLVSTPRPASRIAYPAYGEAVPRR